VTVKPEPAPASGHGSTLAALTLGLVALGAVVIAPPFAITLIFVVAPAWFGADVIARRRQRKHGLPTSLARKLAWIAVLAITMPIVLGIALFTAVAVVCQFSPPGNFH
jgi:hypothetical protein